MPYTLYPMPYAIYPVTLNLSPQASQFHPCNPNTVNPKGERGRRRQRGRRLDQDRGTRVGDLRRVCLRYQPRGTGWGRGGVCPRGTRDLRGVQFHGELSAGRGGAAVARGRLGRRWDLHRQQRDGAERGWYLHNR